MLRVHAVSSCHNPASLDQGSSAIVVVAAARSELKRDLKGEKRPSFCMNLIPESAAETVHAYFFFHSRLPARAKSWVRPPHLPRPLKICPPGTWAGASAQTALVKNIKIDGSIYTRFPRSFIMLLAFHPQT